MRSCGFCNLSVIVIRPEDTTESLKRKARLAAILGTIQSTFTDFRYLRPIWKRNAEEERLLGVSMTGIYDHREMSEMVTYGEGLGHELESIKQVVNETNNEWASLLGINPSLATTTIKPEGTTSALANTGSGIHARHAEFYIRSVRQDNKDALTPFLKDQGIPWEPCAMRPESTTVFFFPVASPAESVTREEVTALSHLDLWKTYNEHWSEHQVSVTVNVREEEWVETAAWVYENWDSITGISFLPFDGGSYKQAPFQECTFQEYTEMVGRLPETIDWAKLSEYELEDTTEGIRELACSGGSCEVSF